MFCCSHIFLQIYKIPPSRKRQKVCCITCYFNFEIELNGEPLKFSGTIDRIDTDGKENFRVIDYKTGKDYFAKNQTNLFATLDHKKPKPYFQHAIYSIAVSDYLASEKIKYSTIEAGYYFSSDKGKWRRVLHTANDSTKEFKTYKKEYKFKSNYNGKTKRCRILL